ncbi:hypothetical protein M422DRAFT_259852 [Sphaerobolus stellatus SS14]|uniref:Uncharacterized protein n=1 Tax=Sphaerobolus stellatus (strain SS14) TaxID=990650 RepID=A0A0C9U3R2_SPHS4|nr:hypothetical protein M422DRAFT_259852 [Sphaerobolus stellatus SS14]
MPSSSQPAGSNLDVIVVGAGFGGDSKKHRILEAYGIGMLILELGSTRAYPYTNIPRTYGKTGIGRKNSPDVRSFGNTLNMWIANSMLKAIFSSMRVS